MKTKTIYLVGGALAAYFLYKKMSAPAATTPAPMTQPTAGQGLVAGGPPGTMSDYVAVGGYGTGNAMLEEMGSLGCSGKR